MTMPGIIDSAPIVRSIATVQRFAGQRIIRAIVDYPSHGLEGHVVTFIGSDTPGYPGPIFTQVGDLSVRVESPERFGDTFNHDWIRAFYAE